MRNRKPTKQQLFLQRYVLTGMALGGYFGIFFRPVREPNPSFALILGLFAALVTLAVRAIRVREWPSLRLASSTYFQFTLLLLVFEGRHYANDFGGRWAVILFTVLAGGLVGYLMARGRLNQFT